MNNRFWLNSMYLLLLFACCFERFWEHFGFQFPNLLVFLPWLSSAYHGTWEPSAVKAESLLWQPLSKLSIDFCNWTSWPFWFYWCVFLNYISFGRLSPQNFSNLPKPASDFHQIISYSLSLSNNLSSISDCFGWRGWIFQSIQVTFQNLPFW